MTDPFVVTGLTAPVEILIDKYGVPHIYAESEPDVFLAQGFNAARDRLFQLDLWRRRGLGQLSEVFGERFTERDRAARLFLYRGDQRVEWLAYGSATKRTVTAFVAGVNAFIDLCEADESQLPTEFRQFGYRPARWNPIDVALIRSHGLFYNVEQEVARARTMRDYGPDIENLRRVREPAHNLVVPDGLDLSDIPDNVLDVYRLATSQPAFTGEDRPGPRTDPEGSNNWVVGPTRSATGRPLLANDPHRAIGLPSLRYIAHLSAPGFDVIGAGEPALPGISIGHNGHIAFGLTIFAIDQEDLYVYETNPANPDEYRYQDRWEPMTVVREQITISGRDPETVELRFTRHGPVVHSDTSRHRAFGIRAAWLEPGMAPYLGSMDYMTARTPDAFLDAMNRWGAPGENQVYAAPDGTFGWRPGGLVPIRPNWDGTMPVPGDGRYEWAGFYDADQLPAERNPDRGWVATANEMNLPVDYPNAERTVTYDWYHRYRYDRIAQVLDTADGFTVHDCVQLQTDTVNVAAQEVQDALRSWRPNGEAVEHGELELAEVIAWLAEWDADATANSGEAALYEIWFRKHLRPALLRHALGTSLVPGDLEDAVRRLLPDEVLASDVRTDLLLIRSLGAGTDKLNAIITSSLRKAIDETAAQLGADRSAWRWGDLHRAAPAHPLAAILPVESAWFNWPRMQPVERAGSGDTVCSTAYDTDFIQTSGATFRIVVDVGDWDQTVAMNAPGQSGRPGDPHWDDLYADWAAGGSFPLLYSRALVEQHTTARYELRPPVG